MAIHTPAAKKLTYISLGALLLGHLMMAGNDLLFAIGIAATSLFVFYHTLRKNDFFSFVMVMYFCSLFPYYTIGRGGVFSIVAFVCVSIYFLIKTSFPAETPLNGKILKVLLFLFIISSVTGWLTNFAGSKNDLFLSVLSFFGVVFLFIMASRTIFNSNRISLFIKINIVLITYSTIASVNKYINIIPFGTPMMPRYGHDIETLGYYESGGIIGPSPMYGQHSLLLLILFFSFYLISFYYKYPISRPKLLFGAIISFLNVFLSISKAVLLLSILCIGLIFLLQNRLVNTKMTRFAFQAILVVFFSFALFSLSNQLNIDYVFSRLEQTDRVIEETGGLSLETIIDGRAINRSTAFEQAFIKYNSKAHWWVGYGWGLPRNMRYAFYVDPSIPRGSAHSQYFAVLFLFGWLGFFAFWGVHALGVAKSFFLMGKKKANYPNRVFALASLMFFLIFFAHGVTADNIYIPSYFAATIILIGLSFANINTAKDISK